MCVIAEPYFTTIVRIYNHYKNYILLRSFFPLSFFFMAQFISETHSIKISQLHINSNICVCSDVVGLIEWTMEINYRLFACRVVRESSSHVEPVSYTSCTSMINLMCFLAPLSIQRPFWVCLWIIWRFIEVICADENGIFYKTHSVTLGWMLCEIIK